MGDIRPSTISREKHLAKISKFIQPRVRTMSCPMGSDPLGRFPTVVVPDWKRILWCQPVVNGNGNHV
ncbi:hypothetical protein HanRHA438_Chr16g0751071 [Helianthus annuus]|nr:hypothetical protein HanRHA438_Chr16g0751071 [Helianthus annuus]